MNLIHSEFALELRKEDSHPRPLRGSVWWSLPTSKRHGKHVRGIRVRHQLLHPEFGEPVDLSEEEPELLGPYGIELHIDGHTSLVRMQWKPTPQIAFRQDLGHQPRERQRISRIRHLDDPGVLVQVNTAPTLQAFGQPHQAYPRHYGLDGVAARCLLTFRGPKQVTNIMVVTDHCGRPVRAWLDEW